MISITWHPHFDVWALIFSLIIFFEYTTDNNYLKKDKRKFWYSGLFILWLFTDWPIHDIGEQYLFCLLYTSPSPRDRTRSRMPSSA